MSPFAAVRRRHCCTEAWCEEAYLAVANALDVDDEEGAGQSDLVLGNLADLFGVATGLAVTNGRST